MLSNRRYNINRLAHRPSGDLAMNSHLSELERKHHELESEITDAMRHRSVDDLVIVDLKRRKLHLKEEIERLRATTAHKA